MQRVTAAIITYNEEKNILKCLESISEVFDDIVVVDSYSSDNTRDICLAWGARFIEKEFQGYGLQKQFATDQALHDYVFNIDADEFLSQDLREAILAEKQRGFLYDGYTMNRMNRFSGQWIRHGSWYPDRKLRLFNRTKGCWSDDIVHEDIHMLEASKISHLKGDLMHNAYDSVAQYQTKNKKYAALSAQLLFTKGKRASSFNLVVNPAWAFLKSYIILLGFLDGRNGLIIARELMDATFLKYHKLRELQKQAAS
jgi:glycosyltransferase involved in cell wall biosynthesis